MVGAAAALGLALLCASGAGATPSHPIPTQIVVAGDASAPERQAAAMLASQLNNISRGRPCFTVSVADGATSPRIAVGHGAAVHLGVRGETLGGLGAEGVLATTNASHGVPPGSVALTGGLAAPRGALYAVDEFLEAIGVRFLSRHATLRPPSLPAAIPATLDVRYIPQLEYRQVFQYQFRGNDTGTQAFNVHRRLNKATQYGQVPTQRWGGAVEYAVPPGFVHTSYALLSPDGSTGGEQAPKKLWAALTFCS